MGRGYRPRRAATPDRTRPEIVVHLAAESVTAALLAAGGSTGIALAGLGMLLYSVIASPGYFAARHERPRPPCSPPWRL